MTLVHVLNGPNLNLLGKRQPEIYGRETLADVERDCVALGAELGIEVVFLQSNWEGQIIDWIHEARGTSAGIVINPGAFTHTSVRELPPPFLHLAARRRHHRRLRHPGLPARPAAHRDADPGRRIMTGSARPEFPGGCP
jgi:hypothetical protein